LHKKKKKPYNQNTRKCSKLWNTNRNLKVLGILFTKMLVKMV